MSDGQQRLLTEGWLAERKVRLAVVPNRSKRPANKAGKRRSARARMRTRTEAPPPGQWHPIPGLPGYRIDRNGRVLGLTNRVMAPQCLDGYARVNIRGGASGGRANVLVHRLVMLTFVGPCPAGHQVNHRNGRRDDNRVTNLEYTTPSENARHCIDVLGRDRAKGEANARSRLTEADVRQMRQMRIDGASASALSAHFGVDRTHVYRICSGGKWGHVT